MILSILQGDRLFLVLLLWSTFSPYVSSLYSWKHRGVESNMPYCDIVFRYSDNYIYVQINTIKKNMNSLPSSATS